MPDSEADEGIKNLAMTVAGIGASAGGLEAFHAFFQGLPADSGAAFIAMLHLPEDRSGMLADMIRRWTQMPVVEVAESAVLEPNVIYVPQPFALATIDDGRLLTRLVRREDAWHARPIDGFFDSLATEFCEQAIGIVLSGTDGALGLKSVRACGGVILALGGGSKPPHDGRPPGPIATGATELMAPMNAIPPHLLYRSAGWRRGTAMPHSEDAAVEARRDICALLHARAGHDFGGYDGQTLMRHVHRRMRLVNIDTQQNYLGRLADDHVEATALCRDLLVPITGFARDPGISGILVHDVLPRLFTGRDVDDAIRVWVPGCGTGEEAYALAILLWEHLGSSREGPQLQIFATDADKSALEIARLGRYPANLLAGFSAESRARFFTASGNSYVIAREIREACTFATHSLIGDPPFSRMDLVSCRNLLIDLDAERQAQVIPTFHFSLVPGGVLLGGPGVSIGRHGDLFAPLNAAPHVYLRRDVRGPPLQLALSPRLRAALSPPGAGVSVLPPEDVPTASGGALLGRGPMDADSSQAWPGGGMGRGWDGLQAAIRSAARRLFPGRSGLGALQHELRETQRQLMALNEEHRTAIEEMRRANENLHVVNEELQSIVQDLETSKEEISSVNQELHAVNAVLSGKVEELGRSNGDLRNVFDSAEVAAIFLDNALAVRRFTPAMRSIYNLIPSDEGRPLTDIASRLHYGSLSDDVRTVLTTLEPLERRVMRVDSETHYMMRILPHRGPDSGISGAIVTFADVTRAVQAEKHQRLLLDELNHRVKNMLTVVVSMASQTLRRSDSIESFATAFMGRVQALTGSYSLLSRANWLDVPLREALMTKMRPFLKGNGLNFMVDGPAVNLKPQGALVFGMAVHELVTNAVKYGAFSVPEGRITASWTVTNGTSRPEFTFTWQEDGGPMVTTPARRGLGTTMIERGFAHELSGNATVEFLPAGVRARLSAPLGEAVYAADQPAPAAGP